MNNLSDDLIKLIVSFWEGPNCVDKSVALLGGINKRWLYITRDEAIWDKFYKFEFCKNKITHKSIHKGPMRESCEIIPRLLIQDVFTIRIIPNGNGRIQIKYQCDDEFHDSTKGHRCTNINHYINPYKSNKKNTFNTCAAKFYDTYKHKMKEPEYRKFYKLIDIQDSIHIYKRNLEKLIKEEKQLDWELRNCNGFDERFKIHSNIIQNA